jgi:hypothetical protein
MTSKVPDAESVDGVELSERPGRAWAAAVASGFDMSLVELSLEKTPWERLREHDDAQTFAARLRIASTQAHVKPE